MGRLTERCGNTYVPNENANYEPMNCMDKLGRLEDLEEQGRLIDFDEQVGYGYLTDWYITSVNENDEPVWTEKHIEELISDFVLIPKDKDTVIIAKWTEDKKCSNCSYTALLDGGEEYVFSRYCPNCGVRMTTKEEAEAKLKELEG